MKSFSPTNPVPNSNEHAIGLPAQPDRGSSCSVSGRVLDVGDLAEGGFANYGLRIHTTTRRNGPATESFQLRNFRTA
jgi:hypothetical protein